jgi:DNA-binding NtrC family response regulator
VGGEKDIDVNVRVVAATNKDLIQEIENGNFREDLYHRLSVILIHNPSLNERVDDIPTLAEMFINEICEDNGMAKKSFTPDALQELKAIHWSGNVRELRNIVERLVILCDHKITAEDVVTYSNNNTKKNKSLDAIDDFVKFQDFKDFAEKLFIEVKLKKNQWNIAKTATEIDIQRSHLYNKIEKYNLKRTKR